MSVKSESSETKSEVSKGEKSEISKLEEKIAKLEERLKSVEKILKEKNSEKKKSTVPTAHAARLLTELALDECDEEWDKDRDNICDCILLAKRQFSTRINGLCLSSVNRLITLGYSIHQQYQKDRNKYDVIITWKK